jgi:hypothetical protein
MGGLAIVWWNDRARVTLFPESLLTLVAEIQVQGHPDEYGQPSLLPSTTICFHVIHSELLK